MIIGAGGLLENDTDVDGDTLTAVLVDAPAHGTVALTSDGSLQYTPNPNFHGADSFTYRASDGQAESDPATVNITVTPIDLAIQLKVSGEAFGADAGVVWAGATFWVNAYVQDRRDTPQGVVGGAVDILFDPLVVLPTGNVVYGEDFSVFQQGHVESANGEIDEAGAISVATNTGATALAPFMAWEFTIVGGLSRADRRATCRICRRTRGGSGDDHAGKLCADRQWRSGRLGSRRPGGGGGRLVLRRLQRRQTRQPF